MKSTSKRKAATPEKPIAINDLGRAYPKDSWILRNATLDDVDTLTKLEHECFETDRISRRQFRWMISRANAALWLASDGATVLGYVLVLFHRGTYLARLYSIAVDRAARGEGLGDRLLKEAERIALEHGSVYLRLEVESGNKPAIALYERHGYRPFGLLADYYQDHSDALRYEKRILAMPEDVSQMVPYYEQTLDFTCGPACLIMAMKFLQPGLVADRFLELQLWREATTVYMTSGHGGCSPQGLAVAASRRGFGVKLLLSQRSPLFLDGVRKPEKKSVLKLVHADFMRQISESDINIRVGKITTRKLIAERSAGRIPLVLISSWRFNARQAPHWVVLAAADATFVYLHDPDVDTSHSKGRVDTQYVPVKHADFDRMIQFGQSRTQAALSVFDPANQ